MAFCNCHSHSSYSLLDGLGTTLQRAQRAKELGQTALSLTDHGNLIGALEHIKDCKEVGIKPIVGVEAYFTPDRFQQTEDNKKSYHLLLLAQDKEGFQNLIKLTTAGWSEGFYYKPRIDWELLEKYNKGIICSSACISGYVPWLIRKNERRKAEEAIEQHLYIFGENRFNLEIMPHDVPDQKMVNIELANLAMKYNVPVLATNDSHYPFKEWQDTQDIILLIATGSTKSKREKKKEEGEDVYEINVDTLHMLSEEELLQSFKDNHPELPDVVVKQGIEQSAKIEELVEVFDMDRSSKMPRVSPSGKRSVKEELHKWCEEGFKRIKKSSDEEYRARFEYEWEVLDEKDALDYMYLVGEMVRWAKSQGIRVSSGRGSAAGCLISYLIGITAIDPIAHRLLFERFMNRARKGMPDIDIDFQADRRDEVKEWLSNRYGEEKVANILALGNYKQKSSIKDVCRVMDIPFKIANDISNIVEDDVPLEEQRKTNEQLDDFAMDNDDVWKHSLRLENQPKQISQHAGGMVVTDKPITDYMPLIKGKHGLLTSWSDRADYPQISDNGFTKIDVLSTDGLTKQGKCVELIKDHYGEDIDLDNLEVATNPNNADQKVMSLFRKGMGLGIWQFNKRGISQFLKRLKPDCFDDLAAANALYRPGPLDGGDAFAYADRKASNSRIGYWPDKIVSDILEPTYGIIIYQEQLQEIAQKVGNLTPEESDDFRKACSKLYRITGDAAKDFMAQYEEQFIAGALENKLEFKTAYEVWERMLAFGGYSFNKSHSSSYSFQSYQDAYLKTYYPLAFYAAYMEEDRIQEFIREARFLDINIRNPDINLSEEQFTLTESDILYGLTRVKYIGENAARAIIENRPYSSVEDFRAKVRPRQINKRALEYLVACGAFDSLGERENLTIEEKRELELESLGVALSGSSEIKNYEDILENRFNSQEDFDNAKPGKSLVVAGEIIEVKRIKTKKGDPMAFGELSYKDSLWPITFFPNTFKKHDKLINISSLVAIKGKKDDRGAIIADNLIELEKIKQAVENDC